MEDGPEAAGTREIARINRLRQRCARKSARPGRVRQDIPVAGPPGAASGASRACSHFDFGQGVRTRAGGRQEPGVSVVVPPENTCSRDAGLDRLQTLATALLLLQ